MQIADEGNTKYKIRCNYVMFLRFGGGLRNRQRQVLETHSRSLEEPPTDCSTHSTGGVAAGDQWAEHRSWCGGWPATEDWALASTLAPSDHTNHTQVRFLELSTNLREVSVPGESTLLTKNFDQPKCS